MWLRASFRRSEPRKDFLWRKKEIAHPSPWCQFQTQGALPGRGVSQAACLRHVPCGGSSRQISAQRGAFLWSQSVITLEVARGAGLCWLVHAQRGCGCISALGCAA